MSDDLKKQVSKFWSGLRQKATDAMAGQEVSLVRGKTAARAVLTDSGEIIVDAGHRIDDAVIERARAAGKLHTLVAAAVSSQAQDLKEKARTYYNSTPEGTEAHSMATQDSYLQARQYIRYTAAIDVTDLRGNVIVPAGKQIDDEDVRAARDANLLAALIYSAQQSPPPGPMAASPPTAPPPKVQAPVHRTARPLTSYYDEEEEENK